MKLVVGLGNPGKNYEGTRHNVGFMTIDKIAYKYNVELNKSKFDGKYIDLVINDQKVILLKPQKYMNLSGEVIKNFMDYFKININDILIIHDDLDLEVGYYRLKIKGGSGGHNGLKNIEKNLNSKEYKRLKIGISNNKNIDTKNYVLGKFTDIEMKKISDVIDIALNVFDDYLHLTFENLMNKYNHNDDTK